MKKRERLEIIKRILDENVVKSQKHLIELLSKEGLDVKQSVISRDLKSLNCAKISDKFGNTKYQEVTQLTSKNNKFYELTSEIILSVARVEFMNVVKTLPANGNLLAALIDEQQFPDVLATLAGHDTVYITSPDVESAIRVNEMIVKNSMYNVE